jgi:uncharacterized OsmC-like protein
MITATYKGGTKFELTDGRHVCVADQPADDGGLDAGPTPVELFVASLAACVGYFVARYCRRHAIAGEGLSVDADWSYAEQPHRVGSISIRLHLPDGFPVEHEERVRKVAEGCTVHRSIEHAPTITLTMEKQAPAEGMRR